MKNKDYQALTLEILVVLVWVRTQETTFLKKSTRCSRDYTLRNIRARNMSYLSLNFVFAFLVTAAIY